MTALRDRAPAPPARLHNMSMRPNTTVRWETGGLGTALVCFTLGPCPEAKIEGLGAHAAELERAWRRVGLRGAALVYDSIPVEHTPAMEISRAVAARPPRIRARDESLVCNVLGRACGGLLLASAPLTLDASWLARELWSDDPRLVALAGVEPFE